MRLKFEVSDKVEDFDVLEEKTPSVRTWQPYRDCCMAL